MRKYRLESPIIQSNNQTCRKNSSCSAKDDVNNPAYNMENVIKQTILLEEHIAEENKYCKPCIVKHFYHIIALLEEAIWMACKTKYPLMETSLEFYSNMFKKWRNNMDDRETCLEVLTKIREWRQKLIEIYVFNNNL